MLNVKKLLLTVILISVLGDTLTGQRIAKNDNPTLSYTTEVAATTFTLSKKEAQFIRSSAEKVLSRFMNLLNFIGTGIGIEDSEMEKAISDSYTLPENKIFFDSLALIKDDLGNHSDNKYSKEKFVSRYLREFDLLYKKNKELSVEFSNYQYSNIKTGQYLYLKISFDCLLKNRSVVTNRTYPLAKRIAELKVEKVNGKWKAWIVSVQFADPENTIAPSNNDVLITEETAEPTNSEGPAASADTKFDGYIKEALFEENSKNFDEAIKNYKEAVKLKPVETGQLQVKIQQLTTRLANASSLLAKYDSGHFKEAIAGYEIAIKADPRWAEYYFGRGKCYERVKDFKQAMKDYNKAIEIDPYNAGIFKTRAALQEILGNYSSAITDYTTYADMDKSDAYVLHKIAFLNILNGNLPQALDAINKAIAVNSKVSSLFHLKGELQIKLNKFSEAGESLTEAIRLDPARADNFFFRGLCNIEKNKIADAGKDFADARKLGLDTQYVVRIEQISQDFYKNGSRLLENGLTDSAIANFNNSISISPDKDLSHFKLGECYSKAGRFESAISAYSRAIILNDKNPEAYRQRGLAYYQMVKYKEAISDFKTSLAASPKQYWLYKMLGDAEYAIQNYSNSSGHYDIAISKFNKTSFEDITLDNLYFLSGKANLSAGNPFKAVQSFDNAIRLNNNNSEFYFKRGEALLNFNELVKAEADLNKAIQLDQRKPVYYFRLSELFQKQGSFDLAINQFKQSPAAALTVDDLSLFQRITPGKDGAYSNTEMGYLLLQLNQVENAILQFDRAIKKDSNDILASYFKAMGLTRIKRPGEAIPVLEKLFVTTGSNIKASTILSDFKDLSEEKGFKELIKKFY